MEGRVLGGDRILGVAAVGCHHLMERGDLVTLVKAHHAFSHCLDISGYIVSLIGGGPVCWPQGRHLPVLRIGARNDNMNQDLASFRNGNIGVSDCQGDILVHDCLLHGYW